MASYRLTLFFIVLLVTVTSLHCGQQLPASGDDDLQQVTTLQYCLVDNCTIKMIDTGEKLDIVYTTDSLIVTTPTHGCNTVVFARLDNEFSCVAPHPMAAGSEMMEFLGLMLSTTLIMIVSGYVAVVHLLFKELRNLFGKLLLCYSLSIVSVCIIVDILLLLHYKIVTNSQALCHITTITFMLAVISVEVFATSLLTHLAYLMYRSYHLKPELPKARSIFLFRCYIAYEIVTVLFTVFLILLSDIPADKSRYTLLADGHCNFLNQNAYTTLVLMYVIACSYKVVQVGMFMVYLYYAYKTYNIISDPLASNRQQKKLFKIAATMGATVGVSFFIFLSVFLVDMSYLPIIAIVGSVYLLLQQAVIMISFMTNRVRQLWKQCLAQRCRIKL